jgi:hypothetical protein
VTRPRLGVEVLLQKSNIGQGSSETRLNIQESAEKSALRKGGIYSVFFGSGGNSLPKIPRHSFQFGRQVDDARDSTGNALDRWSYRSCCSVVGGLLLCLHCIFVHKCFSFQQVNQMQDMLLKESLVMRSRV